ncbi:MAG: hypothetical protein GY822_12025 [Deltaproteobacteria bacterium]|nr:hypothetical protein [Deltaproteobacteria bacterium]
MAGEFVNAAGNAVTDRTCSTCVDGFSTTTNAASCSPYDTCVAGEFVSDAGNSTTDRNRSSCVNSYSTTTNAASCSPYDTCVAGEFVSGAGNATTDRNRSSCVNSYSTTTNASMCIPWRVCHLGQVSAGTDASDRECNSEPVQAGAAAGHSYVLFDDGNAKCWGIGGRLGNNSTDSSLTRVHVAGFDNAVFISTGGGHTCVILETGTVDCWGLGNKGQLGVGVTANRVYSVAVDFLSDIVSASAEAQHTCAANDSGVTYCWGDESNGKVGSGDVTGTQSQPLIVQGISDVREISAGRDHTCALLNTGTVQCWGDNLFWAARRWHKLRPPCSDDSHRSHQRRIGPRLGNQYLRHAQQWPFHLLGFIGSSQVGDGTVVSRTVPTTVPGLSGVDWGGIGERFACALLNTGRVECWGSNGD